MGIFFWEEVPPDGSTSFPLFLITVLVPQMDLWILDDLFGGMGSMDKLRIIENTIASVHFP